MIKYGMVVCRYDQMLLNVAACVCGGGREGGGVWCTPQHSNFNINVHYQLVHILVYNNIRQA
jgi:hypothetical protein